MSQNISGFGLVVSIIASQTFPIGVLINNWVDDTDPFDFPELTIGDSAMTANGQLVFWTSPKPVEVNLAVIPNSYSDIQLAILLRNNTAGYNKSVANDVITMTAIYPNNPEATLVLSQGYMLKGMPATSMASSARQKTKTYGFVFETISGGV